MVDVSAAKDWFPAHQQLQGAEYQEFGNLQYTANEDAADGGARFTPEMNRRYDKLLEKARRRYLQRNRHPLRSEQLRRSQATRSVTHARASKSRASGSASSCGGSDQGGSSDARRSSSTADGDDPDGEPQAKVVPPELMVFVDELAGLAATLFLDGEGHRARSDTRSLVDNERLPNVVSRRRRQE
jgi:hypothetical protein